MDHKAQLKLQALLDGELPKAEAEKVTNWVARDHEAGALLAELHNTRDALHGFEAEVRLPESREFFWSKVQREIEHLEMPAPKPAPLPWFAVLRRFLVPASGLALVVTAGLFLTRPATHSVGAGPAEAETALADSGAFTYRDYAAGTTLVWLSYPADNEVAQNGDAGTVE